MVAGAGPAGSATAALVARAGLRVLLVDRAAFPRDKACSDFMSPAAVRILDRLGVLRAVEAAGGTPLEGIAVTAAHGARLHGEFARAGPRPGQSSGLSVSRRVLDRELLEAARSAGAEVLERTTVERLLYEGNAVAGAVLRDHDGRRRALRARLTVGADGLRSIVSRRLGGRRHRRPRRLAFVAHLEGVEGLDASAEMYVGTGGYVGLNPLGGGRTSVALVVPAAHAGAARGRAEDFFLERLEDFPDVARRVEHSRVVRRVLATGPFAAWSGRTVADGAALVGDAADFFDPFTGEGIHCALRGAELLSDHAVRALDGAGAVSAAALAGYRRARRRAFAGKWAVERLVGYGMGLPRLFDRAVGRLGRRGLAHTFIGVTGDCLPARAVLNPWFLARMVF